VTRDKKGKGKGRFGKDSLEKGAEFQERGGDLTGQEPEEKKGGKKNKDYSCNWKDQVQRT